LEINEINVTFSEDLMKSEERRGRVREKAKDDDNGHTHICIGAHTCVVEGGRTPLTSATTTAKKAG
jgi:hypothetical protein